MTATLLRPSQGNGGGGRTGFYQNDQALARVGLGRGEQLNTDSSNPNSAPVWAFESGSVLPQFRQDSVNGLIPPHQLTHVITKVFTERFSPYKAIELFPVNREGGWDDYIEHYLMSHTGRAAQVCCANDFPRVSINGRAFKTPIITIGTGYEVCYSDLKKAEKAGLGYVERLTIAAKQVIQQTLNAYAFQGDSRAGILGLANNPMLGLQMSPVRLDDPTVDPLLILQILQNACRSGYVASGMANPLPDTLASAPSLIQSWASRPMSGQNTTSILKTFLATGAVKNVVEAPELESTGPNKSRTTVFYRADPDSVEWRVPGSVETLQPFWNGFGYEVNIIARVSSLWFYYAQEVVKLIG